MDSARGGTGAAADSVKKLTLPDACRAPFADPTWPGKLILGGALNLIPVIGVLWPTGYAVAYTRRLLRDPADRRLPEWAGWRALFGDGLAVWTVAAVWQAPGLLLLSVAFSYLTVAAIEWAGVAATGTGGAFGPPALIWTAAGLLVLLAGLIVLPASLLLFVITGRYGDAFRPREILRIIGADRRGYLAVWWRCCLTALIAIALSIFPPTLIVLLAVGPWAGFHLALVWALLWAEWAAEKGIRPEV